MESNTTLFSSSRRSKILFVTCAFLCIVSVAVCVLAVALPRGSSVASDSKMVERNAVMDELNRASEHVEDENLKFTVESSGVKLPHINKVYTIFKGRDVYYFSIIRTI